MGLAAPQKGAMIGFSSLENPCGYLPVFFIRPHPMTSLDGSKTQGEKCQ
jgi:hypothetical protein